MPDIPILAVNAADTDTYGLSNLAVQDIVDKDTNA